MENGESPPFWQTPATLTRRRRRWSSWPILHSSIVVILLPSLSLLFFVFIVVPSIPKFLPHNFHSKPNNPQTSNLKPISVKKSWQSLNVVLVVFAILFGVFARRNDDVPPPENHHHHHRKEIINDGLWQRSKSGDQFNAASQQWFGYSEQRICSPLTPVTGISRLRRTVSELPPAQGSGWETGNDKLRFLDDFDVSKFFPVTPNDVIHHHYHHVIPEMNGSEPGIDEQTVKEIPVDTFVLETRGELPSPTISPPSTPPPRSPAPPLPPQVSNKKPKRTFQSLPQREPAPPPPPPPPPHPPPQPQPEPTAAYVGWGEKKKRSSRKRINPTKEIANAIIASLYSNRKKKQKLKSRKNYEEPLVVESESASTQSPPPPPTPPPPPPPPSVFQSLFRKSSKMKKIHSLSTIPASQSPPRRKPIICPGKPPLPTNKGNQSPLIPTPPPPPTPPIRVAEMKFVMGGGYVRVRSSQSSRCGSPELEDVDESASSEKNDHDEERERNGGPSMSSSSTVTCPSPDVNAKADNFIARLHGEWRLEKLNSWREKHYSGPRPTV